MNVSVSGTPFEITQVYLMNSTLPGVEVRAEKLAIPGTEGYDIFVKGSTIDFTGQISGSVRVETNVPGEEQLDFRFAGMAG